MNHCFEICHYQHNVPQHYYLLDTLVILWGTGEGWGTPLYFIFDIERVSLIVYMYNSNKSISSESKNKTKQHLTHEDLNGSDHNQPFYRAVK